MYSNFLSLGQQQIIDKHVAQALVDLDDSNIMLDLRRFNGKVNSDKFDAFWNELQAYLDDLGLAVDERRHSAVLHMPIAVSIRHFQDIISEHLIAKTRIQQIFLQWNGYDISFGQKSLFSLSSSLYW